MERVVIGVDPHKLSATIEVIDDGEKLLGSGRFTTDKAGFAAMRKYVKQWPDRTWAVEGSLGVGRPLAQRLMETGERVVDVPDKLAARARLLDTGHGRKTDAQDVHSVAVAAVRAKELRVLAPDGELEALRLLVDHRDQLSNQRVATVNRLHRLLAELTPGHAKKDITALQAKAILASVRPRDVVGKTRRRVAADEPANLITIEKKVKALTTEIKAIVKERGSNLMGLPGVGPVVAGASWPTSATSPASPTATGSRPGPAPPHSMHPQANRPATGSPCRQPQDEPDDPHRRDHPDPAGHRRPRLLPTQARRRQDPHAGHAMPQTTHLRRRLSPADRRRTCRTDRGRWNGSGRALRGASRIQRGRPAPAHRNFGSATSRTRKPDATTGSEAPEDLQRSRPSSRLLTTEGSRNDAGLRASLIVAAGATGSEGHSALALSLLDVGGRELPGSQTGLFGREHAPFPCLHGAEIRRLLAGEEGECGAAVRE